MEEASGKVQKVRTHDSGVGVDIAIVERHGASEDVDATSILPNNGRTSVKASTPTGQWGGFMVEEAINLGAMGRGMVACLVASAMEGKV